LYPFAATERMLPFCKSLKPGTLFNWDSELNEQFESKSVIVEEMEEGVRIFEKSKPTCLQPQKHFHCPSTEPFCCCTGWKVTFIGSRFTHAAESRYAFAVADALNKARFFAQGCSYLIIAIDHKPLLKVFE